MTSRPKYISPVGGLPAIPHRLRQESFYLPEPTRVQRSAKSDENRRHGIGATPHMRGPAIRQNVARRDRRSQPPLGRESFGARAGQPPDDRRRCLVGAAQIARHPDRAARQLLGEPGKIGSLRTIARKVQLAIDPTTMVYRRVPDPPKAGSKLAHFAAAVSSI